VVFSGRSHVSYPQLTTFVDQPSCGPICGISFSDRHLPPLRREWTGTQRDINELENILENMAAAVQTSFPIWPKMQGARIFWQPPSILIPSILVELDIVDNLNLDCRL